MFILRSERRHYLHIWAQETLLIKSRDRSTMIWYDRTMCQMVMETFQIPRETTGCDSYSNNCTHWNYFYLTFICLNICQISWCWDFPEEIFLINYGYYSLTWRGEKNLRPSLGEIKLCKTSSLLVSAPNKLAIYQTIKTISTLLRTTPEYT